MRTLKTIAAAGLLLGATSAMAQTLSAQHDEGFFIFKVPDAFTLECDDDHATLEENQIDAMTVRNRASLKDAEAYIECVATSTRSQWTISLVADNDGKMLLDGSADEYLQITEPGRTTDAGVLGMYVEFTGATTFAGGTTDASIGTLDGSGDIKTPYIEDGAPASVNGGLLPESLTGTIDFANALDGATHFGARTPSNDRTTAGFTFRIHGAFVTNGDISSPKGTYKEKVTITIDTVTI